VKEKRGPSTPNLVSVTGGGTSSTPKNGEYPKPFRRQARGGWRKSRERKGKRPSLGVMPKAGGPARKTFTWEPI